MRATPPPCILVVEDSDEDFDTAHEAAQAARLPHTVLRAATGRECLALLRAENGHGMHPALVLMDLNLPDVDGHDALQAIKADAALRHLPVVVLSTSGNARDIEFCYRMGANAFHSKPIRYEEHLALLRTIFAYWLRSVALTQRRENSL